MDGNANPSTPGNNAEANDSQMAETSPVRPYVQQFSANTAMILQRIKSGSSGLGLGMLGNGAPPPPGFEDMKKSVMQGMRTSHNMELPTPLTAQARRLANITPDQSYSSTYVTPYASKAPAGRCSSTPRATSNGDTGSAKGSTKRAARGRGTKRKRMKEESISAEEDSDNMPDLGGDSESDGSGDIVMPRMTQSGRQIVKPQAFVPSPAGPASRRRGPSKRSQDEKTEQALCKRCGRGHSPPNNQIVFCDGCNGGWHQMCHDPMISDEVTRTEDSDWFCTDCGAKRGIVPPFDPTKGVSWQGRSTDQKREYLQSLSQQQLVSLLLHSSNLHPNLPIFPPSPTQGRKTISSKTTPTTHGHPQHAGKSLPPSATPTPSGTLFSRSEANPNAPINFIRKIQSGSNTPINTPSPTASSSFTQNAQQQNSGNSNPTNKNLSSAQKPAQPSSAPPSLPSNQNTGPSGAPLFGDEDADGSRESTPASPPYPKPGMGLMARLPPDDQDEEWLVDHSDYDVFTTWTPADGSH